jgi:hypothetical protein
MQCPKCQSPNTQLCSIAHEQGTSTTKTSGTATGQSVGYSAGGGFGVAQHNIQSSSTSTTKTAFAQRAAPPTNWFVIFVLSTIGSAIFLFIVLHYLPNGADVGGGVGNLVRPIRSAALLWTAISLVCLALTYPKRHKYAEEKRRWQASWICAACGNIFVPVTAGKAN